MKEHSAGLLIYRYKDRQLEVFIVHPGGPFFAKKDNGVWNLPKGKIEDNEGALEAAKREFKEETSFDLPQGKFLDLGEVFYPRGNKKVTVWAVEGDFDANQLKSNTFELSWPPRSGKKQAFPEIDKGAWFDLPTASKKLFQPMVTFLERLANQLHVPFGAEEIPEPPAQGSLF